MGQRPLWCFKLIAVIGPFVLLGCMGLLAGTNLDVMYSYGYGAEKNKVSVWQTCFAPLGDKPAECVPVTGDRQCSELSSKLNVIGIMSMISGFNLLLTIISIIADMQGCQIPVKNLTKIFFCWSIVPLLLALAVAVMGMVSAQCGATQSLEDQEGAYGPAFQMLASAFFGIFIGLLIHICAMHFIGSAQPPSSMNDDDEEDDENML